MSYVYLAFYSENLYKIGCSGQPEWRIKALAADVWPSPYLIKTWLRPKDAFKIEQKTHRILGEFRRYKEYSTEMFECSEVVARDGVERAIHFFDFVPPPRVLVPYVQIPGAPHKMGYAPLGASKGSLTKIIGAGVTPDQIYDDARPLMKASREGDIIVLAKDTDFPYPATRLAERGVSLQLV